MAIYDRPLNLSRFSKTLNGLKITLRLVHGLAGLRSAIDVTIHSDFFSRGKRGGEFPYAFFYRLFSVYFFSYYIQKEKGKRARRKMFYSRPLHSKASAVFFNRNRHKSERSSLAGFPVGKKVEEEREEEEKKTEENKKSGKGQIKNDEDGTADG